MRAGIVWYSRSSSERNSCRRGEDEARMRGQQALKRPQYEVIIIQRVSDNKFFQETGRRLGL